jgi:hypothetical protein
LNSGCQPLAVDLYATGNRLGRGMGVAGEQECCDKEFRNASHDRLRFGFCRYVEQGPGESTTLPRVVSMGAAA